MIKIIRGFILFFDGKIPSSIFYFLLQLISKCKTCYDGYLYPKYGIAPHDSGKTGSLIISEKEWSENYDNCNDGCGVYYCPNKDCEYSKEKQHKKLYDLYNKKY